MAKISFRLRCAKTMLSGAIFIENDEDESDMDIDSKSTSVASNEHDSSTKLSDAVEDAVMEQVVMATHMKTELMASVKKLHDDSSSDLKRFGRIGGNDTLEECNVKPSDLRRLSCDSQLLHFENIANMKKRKSLTERELAKESVLEIEEEVLIECEPVMQKNKVSELSAVFMRNSKKHVKDSTRRRTLDDDCFVFNSYNVEPTDGLLTETSTAESTPAEAQSKPSKLELVTKTEKQSNVHEVQYPRLRQCGTLSRSSTWSSFDGDIYEKNMKSETYLDSVTALNTEIQQLNQAYVVNEDTSKETSVAELVNLHDKIIREKNDKRTSSSTSPLTDLTLTLDGDNNPNAFVHRTIKDIQNENITKNLKRVQSFPKRNRMNLVSGGERSDLRSMDGGESRSLPASPNVLKKELDGFYPSSVDVFTKSNEDNNQQQQQQQCQQERRVADPVLLTDVKRIVSTYETRQMSVDANEGENDSHLSVAERKRSRSTGENIKAVEEVRERRSSSVNVDLRSFDENQGKSSSTQRKL